MLLYGIWQTDKLDIPVAKDGIIPKNVYGNVEVPPLAYCLPIGTVHLCHKRLIPICKKLGIDYAPAVVGFDRSRAGVTPTIEGVVVCVVRGCPLIFLSSKQWNKKMNAGMNHSFF